MKAQTDKPDKKPKPAQKYILRLYIIGASLKSERAIANTKKICEEYLTGQYELEVIDVYQQPMLAKGDQIIAAPTLIKILPLPLRRFVGDLSDTERILLGLDLNVVPAASKSTQSIED